jgi:hypothetical protein
MNVFPRSPVPPWHRDAYYGTPQTLTSAGAVRLDVEQTLLNAILPGDSIAITIAEPATDETCNSDLLTKEIFIPKINENNTRTFVLTGNFVGFDTITFNATGTSIKLRYSGGGWHIVGGNALAE